MGTLLPDGVMPTAVHVSPVAREWASLNPAAVLYILSVNYADQLQRAYPPTTQQRMPGSNPFCKAHSWVRSALMHAVGITAGPQLSHSVVAPTLGDVAGQDTARRFGLGMRSSHPRLVYKSRWDTGRQSLGRCNKLD